METRIYNWVPITLGVQEPQIRLGTAIRPGYQKRPHLVLGTTMGARDDTRAWRTLGLRNHNGARGSKGPQWVLGPTMGAMDNNRRETQGFLGATRKPRDHKGDQGPLG